MLKYEVNIYLLLHKQNNTLKLKENIAVVGIYYCIDFQLLPTGKLFNFFLFIK